MRTGRQKPVLGHGNESSLTCCYKESHLLEVETALQASSDFPACTISQKRKSFYRALSAEKFFHFM